MSRYRGPRIRIVRRLGELRGLTKKVTTRTRPPGQHDTKPGASSEYAIRLKENRTLIGMCGFLNEPYGIDFGYRYSKISWGKGLGFEAAKKVLNYGFLELGLEKVVGLTAEENHGSVRILEKLGFKFEEKFLFNNTKAFKYHYTRGFDR